MYRLIAFFVIMRNTAIINAIYELLIAYNPSSLAKKDADSFKYLIAQLVRQYDILVSKILCLFISKFKFEFCE